MNEESDYRYIYTAGYYTEWEYHHFDEIFIIGFTTSCQFDNFGDSPHTGQQYKRVAMDFHHQVYIIHFGVNYSRIPLIDSTKYWWL